MMSKALYVGHCLGPRRDVDRVGPQRGDRRRDDEDLDAGHPVLAREEDAIDVARDVACYQAGRPAGLGHVNGRSVARREHQV